MNEKPLTESQEMYLKSIYLLWKRNGRVGVSDVAYFLNVSKASVCRAVEILIGKNYLSKEKYKEISLTATGKKNAQTICNKYEMLINFLTILELTEEQSNKYACRFEHLVDDELMIAINKKINIRYI